MQACDFSRYSRKLQKRAAKLDLRNFATRSEVIVFFFLEKVKLFFSRFILIPFPTIYAIFDVSHHTIV